MLMPGVISHATDLVEHPELVAERIVNFAGLVGRENVQTGTDCGTVRRRPRGDRPGQAKAMSDGAADRVEATLGEVTVWLPASLRSLRVGHDRAVRPLKAGWHACVRHDFLEVPLRLTVMPFVR